MGNVLHNKITGELSIQAIISRDNFLVEILFSKYKSLYQKCNIFVLHFLLHFLFHFLLHYVFVRLI